MQRIRAGRHCTFRIQQMIVTRSQAKADERSRIWDRLRLPPMIGLILAHCIFAGLVPGSGGFAAQIMFADQRFLNGLRPLRIDLLLATRGRLLLASRTGAFRFAVMSYSRAIRFGMRTRNGMRGRLRLGLGSCLYPWLYG